MTEMLRLSWDLVMQPVFLQQFPGLIFSGSIGIYLKIRMRFGINLESEGVINPQ